MLYRRIAKHLNAQNWIAVLLDLVIVVIGVFIGIQVANWNEELRERRQELRAVERLEEEVETLARARERRRNFAVFVRDGLDEAARTVFAIEPSGEVSEEACSAIVLSHVYASQPDHLPAVEELAATGRIDILRNEKLRTAILNFVRARDHGRTTLEAVGRDIYKFSQHHPDLIDVSLVASDDSQSLLPRMKCDTEGMRSNQGFRNALISNRAIYAEYYLRLFTVVDDALAALQAELE